MASGSQMVRKRTGEDDGSYNCKLVKKEEMKPMGEHKPVDNDVEEYVRHIYNARADVGQRAEASENVAKSLLPKTSFCKLLISTKKPHHNGTLRNTTPSGRSGVNHSTPWADPLETIRADVRFFMVNPNNYTTLVKLTMWTAHALPSERLFLRTLIKTDASQAAVNDIGWVYNHYFSITPEELEKNMNKTTFVFKMDISMQNQ